MPHIGEKKAGLTVFFNTQDKVGRRLVQGAPLGVLLHGCARKDK
jgi:hypothetical protein